MQCTRGYYIGFVVGKMSCLAGDLFPIYNYQTGPDQTLAETPTEISPVVIVSLLSVKISSQRKMNVKVRLEPIQLIMALLLRLSPLTMIIVIKYRFHLHSNTYGKIKHQSTMF